MKRNWHFLFLTFLAYAMIGWGDCRCKKVAVLLLAVVFVDFLLTMVYRVG